MKWTPVSDCIPQEMENVLLYDKVIGPCIGYHFELTNGFIQSSDGMRLENVSHWMPLPDEPGLGEEITSAIRAVRDYRTSLA